MVEGGEDKELLDQTFTSSKYHHVVLVPGKYAKRIPRNPHYVVAITNPRNQLEMRNLLLQAFSTC